MYCPRHRLPQYNTFINSFNNETGLLEPSRASAEYDKTKPINRTVNNVVLYLFGPMREDKLEIILIIIQILNSVLVLLTRYYLISYIL